MFENKNHAARHRELLARILTSPSFHRSTRSRQLLEYLAGHYFQASGTLLHEVDIGKSLFERGDDFDPAIDSIVRSSMRQLRARLSDYYEAEGNFESIELQIPKGEYRLCFIERFVERPGAVVDGDQSPSRSSSSVPGRNDLLVASGRPELLPLPQPQPEVAKKLRPATRWLHFAMVVGIAVAAFLGGRYFQVETAPPAIVPSQAFASQGSLFEKFLDETTGRIDFVPSDSVLNLIRSYTGARVAFEDYRSRQIFRREHPAGQQNPRYWETLITRELLNIGDASIVLRAAQSFPRHASRFGFRQSRDLRARDLRNGNFVFLGSDGANPWTRTFTNLMNFRFHYGTEGNPSRWENRLVRPGELSQYPPTHEILQADVDQSYAHVAVVSNLSDNGKVMLVAGLSQPDTEAAGEFVLAPHSAETMANAMGVKRLADVPFFEVILKTEKVGNAWRVSEVVAHRVHYSAVTYHPDAGRMVVARDSIVR